MIFIHTVLGQEVGSRTELNLLTQHSHSKPNCERPHNTIHDDIAITSLVCNIFLTKMYFLHAWLYDRKGHLHPLKQSFHWLAVLHMIMTVPTNSENLSVFSPMMTSPPCSSNIWTSVDAFSHTLFSIFCLLFFRRTLSHSLSRKLSHCSLQSPPPLPHSSPLTSSLLSSYPLPLSLSPCKIWCQSCSSTSQLLSLSISK